MLLEKMNDRDISSGFFCGTIFVESAVGIFSLKKFLEVSLKALRQHQEVPRVTDQAAVDYILHELHASHMPTRYQVQPIQFVILTYPVRLSCFLRILVKAQY